MPVTTPKTKPKKRLRRPLRNRLPWPHSCIKTNARSTNRLIRTTMPAVSQREYSALRAAAYHSAASGNSVVATYDRALKLSGRTCRSMIARLSLSKPASMATFPPCIALMAVPGFQPVCTGQSTSIGEHRRPVIDYLRPICVNWHHARKAAGIGRFSGDFGEFEEVPDAGVQFQHVDPGDEAGAGPLVEQRRA